MLKFTLDENSAKSITTPNDIVMSTANTERFAQAFFQETVQDMGLLPLAVRWISKDNKTMIVERPPAIHTVTYGHTDNDEFDEEYTIAVPWTVYGLRFRDDRAQHIRAMYLLTRPGPIYTMEDPLYIAPYPNMYSGREQACLGWQMEETQFINLADAINQTVGMFFNAKFNNDLEGRLLEVSDPYGGPHQYFKHLESLSMDDVLNVANMKRSETYPRVSDLIAALEQEDHDEPSSALGLLYSYVVRSAS